MVKNTPGNAGNTGEMQGLNPGLGRPPGEGNGNLLQYSCLENSTDKAWQAAVHGVARVRHDWARMHSRHRMGFNEALSSVAGSWSKNML